MREFRLMQKTKQLTGSITKFLGLVFLIILLCVGSVSGQKIKKSQQDESKSIDSKIQTEIIDSVSAALNEIYVFPETAKKMEKHIRKQYKKKIYKNITSLKEFTGKLTEDLRSISKDKHLRVRYSPDEEAELFKDDSLLTDDEKKRLREEQLAEMAYGNFGFKKVEHLPGNIGYLKFDGFYNARAGGRTAIAAISFLAHCDAIIIDLRENGGGSPSMIQLLSSYLFEEPMHLNSFYIRSEDAMRQFWTQAYVEGPRVEDADIYVLTSRRTFSGAEEFTYNLKNMGRATIVGETTGGGAHPVNGRRFANLNVVMSLPYGRAVNPITNTNWEGTGVTPHIEVPQNEAFDVAYLTALRKLKENTDDSDRISAIEWAITGKEVQLYPVTLESEKLHEYVGIYGPRKITIEGSKLYYQRDTNPKYKLTPMGNDMFIVEGLDYFRIGFKRDSKSDIVEIIGYYYNGRTDSHRKE